MSKTPKAWLYPVLFMLLLILLWEVYVRVAHVPAYLVPAPSAILTRMLTSRAVLMKHGWVTLIEVLAGFAGGIIMGGILAIAIVYSPLVERTLYPLIVASQAVPKIAIAPLFILWFGFGLWPKVVVTILLTFFPIVVATADGLMSVDRNLINLLRSVHAPEWVIFTKVRLPNALPPIMTGLKIAITLAVVGAVVGEWVGADSGLGYLLQYANTQLDSTLLFSALMYLVIIGIVLYVAVEWLERKLLPWQEKVRNTQAGV